MYKRAMDLGRNGQNQGPGMYQHFFESQKDQYDMQIGMLRRPAPAQEKPQQKSRTLNRANPLSNSGRSLIHDRPPKPIIAAPTSQ